jgi:hypothetical protein
LESAFIIVISVIIGLILNKYLPSYFGEKGKNLATKEDVEEITSKVEKVKFQLENDKNNINKKKEIYELISEALNIFISNRSVSDDEKNKFYKAYSLAWLWASNDVLEKLNFFIEYQIKNINKSTYNQDEAKRLYADIILNMRKDLDFKIEGLSTNSYKFVTFS